MAIGSQGEYGVKFGRFGEMSPEMQQAWFDFIRENWHPNLMAGYATICYPKRRNDGREVRDVS